MGKNEITKNLVYLTEHLTNLQGVLDHLQQDGTISRDEREDIESEKTSLRKNRKLLTLIQMKDWLKVRDRFIEILRRTTNEHCADKIEGKESQATGNKRNERENESNKSTNRAKISYTKKSDKIRKWWPEEKRLIESLHKRKKGDHLLVDELHDRIQKDKNRTVVICESTEATKYSGMGGMGKTLTAKWYAHHYEEHYDHILWIDCGEGSLFKSFERLARDLKIEDRKQLLDVEEFARKCFQSLLGFRCLWIFDNAESYNEKEGIIKALPNQQHCFCLITSRSQEWGVKNGLLISNLQLDIFSHEESLAFLKKELDKEIKSTELELNELCRLLGNLPLALQLAVAALNNSHMEVKTFLKKSKFVKVLDAEFDDYEKIINGNVKVSLDLIEKEKFGRTANEILMIFGYIRPDDIQLQFFKSVLQIKNEREIKESVKLLTKYSLVAKTEIMNDENEEFAFLSVHRLLQQIIRHNSKEKETNLFRKIFKGNKENQILRKIFSCERFIDYKLFPFTKYADEDLKKEFPKVKAQLLDQQQLQKLIGEKRLEECVQLSKFIHQELLRPSTKWNSAICQHLNGQLEECVKTAEELLAEFPLGVKDDQLSRALQQILLHLKRVNLRVDVKRNYYLRDLGQENNEKLREEELGDLLLFSYLRLNKFDSAIAIVKQTASHNRIFSILIAVMVQKKFNTYVVLAKLINEELKTKTTKLNYAICLQKNGQLEESVATLNELDQQEVEEQIEYYDEDVRMGLFRLDVEVSRELVGGHLLLAVWTMENKEKIEDLLKKRKEFFIYSVENLDILIRLVHSHLIHYNCSLVQEYSSSFIALNLEVETKRIYLMDCSLSLDSFNRLSPEELTLDWVSFFRDDQKLEEVKLNDFIDFKNIKRLTLKCNENKKNLSVDLTGDVSLDSLWLENVKVLNWSSCNWNVKKLYLDNVPFVKRTHIQVQQMNIWSSSLDVSCLPPTIQKITLSGMEEVFVSGGMELPNLKKLTLTGMSDVGCLCHFHSAPLTHIHLDYIKGEVNVDLLPPTLTQLRIINNYYDVRVVGGVRRVDNLTLERFSFEGVEECLSHLHTDNLIIHSESRSSNEVKYLVELMKKQIQTIAVGEINWDTEKFKNYSSQLDRRAEFYLLEKGTGRGMEREEFKELIKDFPGAKDE